MVPLKTRQVPRRLNYRHRRLQAPLVRDSEAIRAVDAASSAPQAKI
jgi:hypothetical protein